MFSADDIQARLRQQPFVPVRIVTTTGQTYDLRHPELAIVGRRFLMVGIPSAENPTQAEQITRIALVHVTELQDLPAANPASGNVPG